MNLMWQGFWFYGKRETGMRNRDWWSEISKGKGSKDLGVTISEDKRIIMIMQLKRE